MIARVIVLAGPSGAGKSRLSRRLGLPVLRLDDFYKDGRDPTLPRIAEGPNHGLVDWDHPDSWLHDVLVEVLDQGVAGYARADVGAGTKVLVEFVSANPTGPLHAGHGRGAAYGDSLARILERVGYEVSRENYLNDRGTQMQLFVASLAARQRHEPVPEGGYQGQYIVDWAAEIPEGADLLEWGEARAVAFVGHRNDRNAPAGQGRQRCSGNRMVQQGLVQRGADDHRGTAADRLGNRATDAGVDLVENERWRRTAIRERHFDGEEKARELTP